MSIDKLLADNMGLVYKQLHKFNRAYDDDAFSAGFEALYRAATTYKKSKGVAFSTYATTCIYNGIAHYMRDEANRLKKEVPLSFETLVSDGDNVTLGDILSDDVTPETECLKKELYAVLWQKFDEVVASFNNKTAENLLYTWKEYGFNITQSELAAIVGISQAYVSRTLSAFKHKLKKEMEEYL